MSIIVSGIKPSGKLTLGNYLGAIKNFVKLQDSMKENDEIYIFIADMHAITVRQESAELRKAIKSLAALYIACGLDPNKCTLFVQSEVKEHVELGYLLQTMTYVGELERMTQYKDKKQKQVEGISSALLTYPSLMAADILLYSADYVPVGLDQKQHLELTRMLAERFNNRYSETFVVPEAIVATVGAKIMNLADPLAKMGKSDDNEKGVIYLLDDSATIKRKIAGAVTDSDGVIKYDPVNKPGISNLLTIYSALSNQTIDDVLISLKGYNYAMFKELVANKIIEELKVIQDKYNQLINSQELDDILDFGANKASIRASKMVYKVKRKMGLIRKK